MTNTPTPRRILSPAEYLELDESTGVRHEYVAGYLYPREGITDRHNLIAGNIASRLHLATRGTTTHVFMSAMLLQAAEDLFYYPDVMVVRDSTDDHPLVRSRPCLIVEVVSPTTESVDRREKLVAYRRLHSLEAYILVYQDEMRLIQYSRDDHGEWWRAELSGEGSVRVPYPRITLSLGDIYKGLPPVRTD